jgi:hypothetical protein
MRLIEFVVGVRLGTLYARGARWKCRCGGAAPLVLGAVIVAAAYAPYSLSRYAVTVALDVAAGLLAMISSPIAVLSLAISLGALGAWMMHA